MGQTIRISVLYAKIKSTDQSAHVQIIICPITTVKPVLSVHSKIDKTKILMTNGSLMKVESIAECSKGSILLYF